jgi:hypothetical protein
MEDKIRIWCDADNKIRFDESNKKYCPTLEEAEKWYEEKLKNY